MEQKMNQKEIIEAVLEESLRLSKRYKFDGVRLSTRTQQLKKSEVGAEIENIISDKIFLFKKMPENCESYKRLLLNARQALYELQKETPKYGLVIYELINTFLRLDSVFKNNIEYIGIREYEKKIFATVKKEETKLPQATGPIRFLETNLTGIKVVRTRKENELIKEMVEDINL